MLMFTVHLDFYWLQNDLLAFLPTCNFSLNELMATVYPAA